MKKFLCLSLIVLCVCTLGASTFSTRSLAMGNTSLNVSDRQGSNFYNPASVFFYGKQNSFNLDFKFSDRFYDISSPFFSSSDSSFAGAFISDRVSLSFDLGFEALKTGEVEYKLAKKVRFGFNAAAGTGDFAAGIGIYLHSERSKDKVEMQTGRLLLDILEKGLFNEFSRDGIVSGVSVKAGLGYMSGNWSASMLFDDFINSMESDKVLSFERVLNSFGLGVGFNTNPYTIRGKLNKLVFGTEVEVWNLFSTDFSVHTGAELTLQLVRNRSVSFRGGVQVPVFYGERGISTFGFGYRIGDVVLNTYCSIPFSMYSNPQNFDISATLDMMVLL